MSDPNEVYENYVPAEPAPVPVTAPAPRFLSREAIFAAPDAVTETVDVPEWGGAVLVRGISAAQRDAYEMSLVRGKGKNVEFNRRNMRTKLVVLAVVDETGRRIFRDADAEALGDKAAAAVDRIYAAAARLAGVSAEDEDELTKNSESDPNDDSPSD